jgi:two-component system response regulator HydG
LTFPWPGNVRQLRNVVESMVVVHYDPPKQAGEQQRQEGLLDLDDLPEELAEPAGPSPEPQTASLAALVGRSLEEIERLFLSETLRACGSNREEAARLLGIGERTLYRKIKEYGL